MEQGLHGTESTAVGMAYAATLKRGSSPTDILAGVKARVGDEKEDTPCAPQFVDLAKSGALEGRHWQGGSVASKWA